MININIMQDLSTLTKVPNKVFNELTTKEILCIGSAIHDALIEKEDILSLNIGIGTLNIQLPDLQCKFIPSKELKNTIKRCLDSKIDPLEFELEQTFIDRLLKLCNEVL